MTYTDSQKPLVSPYDMTPTQPNPSRVRHPTRSPFTALASLLEHSRSAPGSARAADSEQTISGLKHHQYLLPACAKSQTGVPTRQRALLRAAAPVRALLSPRGRRPPGSPGPCVVQQGGEGHRQLRPEGFAVQDRVWPTSCPSAPLAPVRPEPHLSAREAGKCSLAPCPGREDGVHDQLAVAATVPFVIVFFF